MKRRELFWMIVPCLLLVGVALWLRGSERDVKPKRTDFRITIEDMRLVPPTPREVALGYDTVVLTKARLEGPRSVNFTDFWRFPFWIEGDLRDSKGNRVSVKSDTWRKNENDKSTYQELIMQQPFLLKLSDVASNRGELYFRAKANGHIYDVSKRRVFTRTESKPIKQLVRKAGEKVKAPMVSKERPFALLGQEVEWIDNRPTLSIEDCQVTFWLDLAEELKAPEGRTAVGIDKAEAVVDGKGRSCDEYGYSEEKNPLPVYCRFSIPSTARNVTFKANLSINGCWPLPIEIELRKDGKNITHVKPKLDN